VFGFGAALITMVGTNIGAGLLIAAGGGWLAIHWFEGGLPALFTAIAAALVAYGTLVAGAVKAGAWREKGLSQE
jgi:hypothetical protein